MRIAFGKKLRGFQRAALIDNAVHEEMISRRKQDQPSPPSAHSRWRSAGIQRYPSTASMADDGAVNEQGNTPRRLSASCNSASPRPRGVPARRDGFVSWSFQSP